MPAEDTRREHQELERRLRPFVARRVPQSEVDDVLQDVFLRMQNALPTLRDEERFAPWIYSIARSAIVDSHRRRSRHTPLELDDGDAVPAALAARDASEPSAIEQEVAAYLVSYVAKLPSPYREALTLTEIQGMTQRAAADALGISLSGMKSRVQRGREKLREAIEQCCRLALDARGHVIDCEPRDPSDCRCKGS